MTNKSWFCGSSPTLTLIYAYAYRVELSGGSYTLVQEGEGAAGSEVNYTCVHQDQGSQIRGKPVGYRGNRPYRCGSVGVTDR
jgi:hypothetical protein